MKATKPAKRSKASVGYKDGLPQAHCGICRPEGQMQGELLMGMEQAQHGAWDKVREIADRLPITKGNVYVAKEYTVNDLRRDLLATIPGAPSNAGTN